MPNTRDIRNRIKGVKSTRQITRAMQMVATSKMKKAQDEAKTGRPYALILADIIVSIADEFEEITQSYFVQRPIRHRGILVIGTDKGLCGALNGNLFRISFLGSKKKPHPIKCLSCLDVSLYTILTSLTL